MPIELYSPFKTEMLQVLSRYQIKERFRRDCTKIQCMINKRECDGKPLNGVYPLIQAIENYCQHELCSNTKPLFFYWTRTIQTKNNDLYIDLKRVMTKHFEAALIWENEKYRVILESNPTTSDVLRLTDRNQQLEKELVAMTIRVDQAEENNEVKNDHIEELLKENARLNQKVKELEDEIAGLKWEIRDLKEKKIPSLEEKFNKQATDFNQKLIDAEQKSQKQIDDLCKKMEKQENRQSSAGRSMVSTLFSKTPTQQTCQRKNKIHCS